MAYQIRALVNIDWIGDGSGPMSVPGAQTLQVQVGNFFGAVTLGGNSAPVQVPGADAPTTGNISTACTTLATQVAALLNAKIGQIQGFASGSG
ncbi:MAG TPA: hypothetical protein VEU47_19110 [Candidatus Cybelea sp.]|nr:hypothetical protein [Candidatus Cybelea sp.]